MTRKKVIILDDHPLMLIGLKSMISQDPMFCISDTCINSTEMLFSLSLAPADIALLDCSRPNGDMNISSLVSELHQLYPNMRLILMGDEPEHRKISEQLQPMLYGYFCKSLVPEKFMVGLHALRLQLIGEQPVLNQELSQPPSNAIRLPQRLSLKEKIVLEYLHAGLSVTQTAARVNRSVKTISSQKRTAMRKLGIKQDLDIFQLKLHEL